MHCGYLSRQGEFIDCSNEHGAFKHEEYCKHLGKDEDYLMDFLGWVKLTTCLPNEYLFTSPRHLSNEQIKWLTENGYEIYKEDYNFESI